MFRDTEGKVVARDAAPALVLDESFARLGADSLKEGFDMLPLDVTRQLEMGGTLPKPHAVRLAGKQVMVEIGNAHFERFVTQIVRKERKIILQASGRHFLDGEHCDAFHKR